MAIFLSDKILTFIGKTFPPDNPATSPTLESPTTLAGKGTAMQGPWKGKQMGGEGKYGTMNRVVASH